MSDELDSYLQVRVNEQTKEAALKQADGMGFNLSDIIRHVIDELVDGAKIVSLVPGEKPEIPDRVSLVTSSSYPTGEALVTDDAPVGGRPSDTLLEKMGKQEEKREERRKLTLDDVEGQGSEDDTGWGL